MSLLPSSSHSRPFFPTPSGTSLSPRTEVLGWGASLRGSPLHSLLPHSLGGTWAKVSGRDLQPLQGSSCCSSPPPGPHTAEEAVPNSKSFGKGRGQLGGSGHQGQGAHLDWPRTSGCAPHLPFPSVLQNQPTTTFTSTSQDQDGSARRAGCTGSKGRRLGWREAEWRVALGVEQKQRDQQQAMVQKERMTGPEGPSGH